jgi:hypothetical protein
MDEEWEIVQDVRSAREDLDHRIVRWLRDRGWRHTSDTPGCLWLFERELPDGRIVLVQESAALYIQSALDAARGRE